MFFVAMSKAISIHNLPDLITEAEISKACETIAGNVVNLKLFSTFAVVEFESNRMMSGLSELKLLEQPVKIYYRKYRGLGDLKHVLQLSNIPACVDWKTLFRYFKFSGTIENILLNVDGTRADIVFHGKQAKDNAKCLIALVPFKYTTPDKEIKEITFEFKDTVDTSIAEHKRRKIE